MSSVTLLIPSESDGAGMTKLALRALSFCEGMSMTAVSSVYRPGAKSMPSS